MIAKSRSTVVIIISTVVIIISSGILFTSVDLKQIDSNV